MIKKFDEFLNEAKTVYYKAENIPADKLEEIIKGIIKREFDGNTVAVTAVQLYKWIAEEWAKMEGNTAPEKAHLDCTFEYKDRSSIHGIPHCNEVDKILYRYMNSYCEGNDEYWHPKNVRLSKVILWINDNKQ